MQSVVMARCRLGYMQRAVSWWQETGEGIGVDFTIHPCEHGKHSLERGKTKWSTHTTRIPYPVPRVIYHTSVNIRKRMCNLLIIAHEYSQTHRVQYS